MGFGAVDVVGWVHVETSVEGWEGGWFLEALGLSAGVMLLLTRSA